MTRFILFLFFLTLSQYSFSDSPEKLNSELLIDNENGISPANISLRIFAEKSGILIGTAVAHMPFINNENYRDILKREYNLITPENSLKFENIQPEQGKFNFSEIDQLIKYAKDNNICIRGTPLVWHKQLPDWLINGDWSREQLIQLMRQYIFKVVREFKGDIQYWDVVNEALSDYWGLRNSIWHDVIGPEYIELAFMFAHEADPDARLFYNDYGIENINWKSSRLFRLLSRLLARGIPIHGLGLQAHFIGGEIPEPEELKNNLERFAALGLEIHITEMDVGIPAPVTDEKLREQAFTYQQILEGCLSNKQCTAFSTWGFTDKYSWIPGHFPGYGNGLPFDNKFQSKPAYKSIKAGLISSQSFRKNKVFNQCGKINADNAVQQ